MERDDIKVSICCITYNHAKYIANALDSFLSQRTSFNFEIIIHDDASTDGTSDIVEEYANKYKDKIRLIQQIENQYSKDISVEIEYAFPQARGKYVAYCEGDDYWCDDTKLQQQYDVMEAHPECSMSAHYTRMVDSNSGEVVGYLPHKKFELKTGVVDKETQFKIIASGVFHLSSCFFRKEYIDEFINATPEYVKVMSEDVEYMYFFAQRGSVYFIESELSVFRANVEGSWTKRVAVIPSKYKHLLEQQIHATELYLEEIQKDYPNFTKYFVEAINLNKVKLAFINNQFSYVLRKENKPYYKKLSRKMRLIACIGRFFPGLIKAYRERRN